ncbi:MAG: SDR family NAD(P)-dependent oxidoreductase [Acidimicrobiia bacterium]
MSDRVALVTGAGGGMGRAIASKLLDAGCAVVLNDVSGSLLEEAARDLTGDADDVVTFSADVTDRRQVARMVTGVKERLGRIDILVNNAGILRPTRLVDIEEDEWDEVLAVSIKGAFLCTQAVVGGMLERGWGRVVNMSSTAGKSVSTMGGCHYTTAKAGLLGFTRAVAAEVASAGVTVNAVCPGLFDTEMTRNTITTDQANAYAESFPIKRLGSPTEVADLIGFLVSDQAGYITGAAIDINGGDLMI